MAKLPISGLGPIPWSLIIERGPALLKAAESLLATFGRKSSGATTASDLPALRERLAQLEEQQQAHVALVTQLTAQLNAVTVAAQASAVRGRQSFILGIVGVALGIIACLFLLLR